MRSLHIAISKLKYSTVNKRQLVGNLTPSEFKVLYDYGYISDNPEYNDIKNRLWALESLSKGISNPRWLYITLTESGKQYFNSFWRKQ